MNTNKLVKRLDGKLEERLDESWVAELSENRESGLWEVELFKHDVPQWHGLDFASLDEARQAMLSYFDQR
jgi:hypothetical protein